MASNSNSSITCSVLGWTGISLILIILVTMAVN